MEFTEDLTYRIPTDSLGAALVWLIILRKKDFSQSVLLCIDLFIQTAVNFSPLKSSLRCQHAGVFLSFFLKLGSNIFVYLWLYYTYLHYNTDNSFGWIIKIPDSWFWIGLLFRGVPNIPCLHDSVRVGRHVFRNQFSRCFPLHPSFLPDTLKLINQQNVK